MEGKCWNCGKMNEEEPCGYFLCDCIDIRDSNGGLWYLPLEIWLERRRLIGEKNNAN